MKYRTTNWKPLQLIQQEADIIIFLSWFFLLFKVLSCFVCQFQKEYCKFCFGFSVPIKISCPTHSHLSMVSAYTPITRSPSVVGCIANDLLPHLSVYTRTFAAANPFWFLNQKKLCFPVKPVFLSCQQSPPVSRWEYEVDLILDVHMQQKII